MRRGGRWRSATLQHFWFTTTPLGRFPTTGVLLLALHAAVAPKQLHLSSIIRAETWLCSAAVRGCCAGSWNMLCQASGWLHERTSPHDRPPIHNRISVRFRDVPLQVLDIRCFDAVCSAIYGTMLRCPPLHAAPSRPASSALRHMQAQRRTFERQAVHCRFYFTHLPCLPPPMFFCALLK